MQPYKCPICGGTGIVPGGFYISTGTSWATNKSSERCRSCKGTGIVWEYIQSYTAAPEAQKGGEGNGL